MLWTIVILMGILLLVLLSYVNSLTKTANNVSLFAQGLLWIMKEKKLVTKEDQEWLVGYINGTKAPKFGSMYHMTDLANFEERNIKTTNK